MGEARRRGTFEERKAEAIAAGRIKKKTERWRKQKQADNSVVMMGLALMAGLRSMGKKRRRKKSKS